MDPNPIKSRGGGFAYLRDAIEPTLLGAGFQFAGRNDPRRDHGPPHLWIDYTRGQELASLRWDVWQAQLSLVVIDKCGVVREIALVGFEDVRSTNGLKERMGQFVQAVQTSAFFRS